MVKRPGFTVRSDIGPGDIPKIVDLHMRLYTDEFGFDSSFAECVEGPIRELKESSDPGERIWIVEQNGEIMGTVGVVAETQETAVIRWLLVDPSLRGQGIGREIMERAVSFARKSGYRSVYLWTVEILEAAALLYLSLGFQIVEEEERGTWGRWLLHQRYMKILGVIDQEV